MVDSMPLNNPSMSTSSAVTPAIAPPSRKVRRRCWSRLRTAMIQIWNMSFVRLHRGERRDARRQERRVEGGDRADEQHDHEGRDHVAYAHAREQARTGEEEVELLAAGRDPDR